jgi:GH35 family endo-1,4-beta-xylanase
MDNHKLTRRDFLKMAGITSAGLALSACGVNVTNFPDPTITPSIMPLPSATNTPTITPVSKPPTLADLARKIGVNIGIETDYLGLSPSSNFSDAPNNYLETLKNFSILTGGDSSSPGWTDEVPDITFQYWHDFSQFCKDNNIQLSLDHMFYGLAHFEEGSIVEYLLNASKSEVEEWMKNRVKRFFEIPYFSQLNFVNEVLYGNDETGEFGWVKHRNPFYNIWGEDYVRQAYLTIFNEAVSTGRNVGDDIRLIYNASNIEYDTPKAQYEYDFLAKLKEQLQKETGIKKPFDIGMQFHTRTRPLKDITCWGPDVNKLEKESLNQHLKNFGEIGDIHISEFTISASEKDQELEILHTVMESAIESGVCKSVIMWGAFVSPDVSWVDCTMKNLFEGNFEDPTPSYIFDELYKILESYAA